MNGLNGAKQVKILQNIEIKPARRVTRTRVKFKIVTKTSCPICKKFLSLRQINRTTAVYLCDDLDCAYPLEENCSYPCIMIKREWKDINKPPPDDREWTEEEWRRAAEKEKLDNAESYEEKVDEKPTELFDIIDSYVEQSQPVQNEEISGSFDEYLADLFN